MTFCRFGLLGGGRDPQRQSMRRQDLTGILKPFADIFKCRSSGLRLSTCYLLLVYEPEAVFPFSLLASEALGRTNSVQRLRKILAFHWPTWTLS
jgi:hypothetical protein